MSNWRQSASSTICRHHAESSAGNRNPCMADTTKQGRQAQYTGSLPRRRALRGGQRGAPPAPSLPAAQHRLLWLQPQLLQPLGPASQPQDPPRWPAAAEPPRAPPPPFDPAAAELRRPLPEPLGVAVPRLAAISSFYGRSGGPGGPSACAAPPTVPFLLQTRSEQSTEVQEMMVSCDQSGAHLVGPGEARRRWRRSAASGRASTVMSAPSSKLPAVHAG